MLPTLARPANGAPSPKTQLPSSTLQALSAMFPSASGAVNAYIDQNQWGIMQVRRWEQHRAEGLRDPPVPLAQT